MRRASCQNRVDERAQTAPGKRRDRQLSALNIRDVRHLCKHLGTFPGELERICRAPKRHYRYRTMETKGKVRPLATPHGELRGILDRLQSLLQRVALPQSIHGGRRKHSYLTNARPHVRKRTVLRMDIQDFFPWISHRRVYRMFHRRLGCSPDVARYLTILTTLNGSLPQGSPTSTIVAALVIRPLAERLAGLARHHRADYTQYVDDITLSGPAHVARLIPTIERIIAQEGFRVNIDKTEVVAAGDEQIVTGVRVNRGTDAPSGKIAETRQLIAALEDQVRLGGTLSRRAIASARGKVRYIECLNRGAGRLLGRRLERLAGAARAPETQNLQT